MLGNASGQRSSVATKGGGDYACLGRRQTLDIRRAAGQVERLGGVNAFGK